MAPTMHQFTLDTRTLPEEDRFRIWSSGLSDFEVELVNPAQPFEAVSTVTGLGPLPISQSVLPPLRFRRDNDLIRARRSDYWNLNLMLEGALELTTEDGRFEAPPGVPILLDLARPVEIVSPAVRAIVVVLPRNLLGVGRRGGAHGPLPPSAQSTLLVGYLTALCAALPELPETAALPSARALCELVAACLPRPGRARPPILRGEALRTRVLEHIDGHLADPLTVERLCAALAVSRSTLYRALEGDGGVEAMVRRVRLEAAHRILSDRSDARALQQVAHAVGYSDDTLFSRHFHAAFGYTAGELQRTASTPSALPADSHDAPKAYSGAVRRLAAGPDAL